MIRTIHLSKDFHDHKRGIVHAVRDVTIHAHAGQIFGILGVNGAGKTTLLRMLSTVLAPTSGQAEVAGFDTIRQARQVRSHIGFLSATTALYGRLTPREALEYFAELYGLSRVAAKKRVDLAIEQFQIGEFADRLCDKLSTGQKQRVSIARTTLHDPPVLFFDEPTSGLDVVTSQAIMEFIEAERDRGKTIVYCTHIMTEAERLCNELAIIHEGRICGQGAPSDLLAQTQTSNLEGAFLALVGYVRGARAAEASA